MHFFLIDEPNSMSFSLSGTALEKLKQTANLKDATADVDQIEGEERLSGAFCYTVRFHLKGGGENSSAPNFDKVIGESIDLSLEHGRGRSRDVSGIVSKIRHHGRGAPLAKENETQKKRDIPGIEAPSFFVKIRPGLWRLHLQNSYRTYSNRAIVSTGSDDPSGILDDLLGAFYQDESITKNLNDSYPKRKHVAQKGETDLEFFQRLAEEAGVVYFFDEGNIVLTDHNSGYEKYSRNGSNGEDPDTLRKVSQHTRARKEGVLNSYSYERNLTPSTAQLRSVDHSQSSPVSDSTTSSEGDGMQTVRETGGQTQYSTKRPRDAFVSTLEKRSAAQITGGKNVLRGHTHSHLLGVGMRFGLDSGTCGDILDHFSSDSQNFVVSRLHVSVNQRVKEEGTKGEFKTVSNILNVEFEAVPELDEADYRGNRYAEQNSVSGGAGGDGGHLRRRFNVIVEKYNLLRDTVFSLARNETPNQVPSGAKGLEDINPYEFTIEPKVGTGRGSKREKEIPAGMYTAEVAAPNSTEEAKKKRKQGMVQVKIDLDGDTTREKVWARTLSFWAGNKYGGQFLPREGAKVAVAYPAQTGEYPFIVGGFYDGKHGMPFSDDPEKQSGMRSQSHRTNSGNGGSNGQSNDKYLHNEISLIDEPNNEEIRILAPTYRTDVVGLEEDVSGEKEEYHKLKENNNKEKYTPQANEYITTDEYKKIKTKSDKICHLKPIYKEVSEWYTLSLSNNEEDITKSDMPDRKESKFVPEEDISKEIKEEIGIKKIGLGKFKSIPERSKSKRREIGISSSFEKWWEDQLDEYIDVEEYISLSEKTSFSYDMEAGYHTISKRFKGVNKIENKWKKRSNKNFRINSLGRDAYNTPSTYRKAYSKILLGKDSYNIEPYKEIYSKDTVEKEKLSHDESYKATYTEGGTLEANQGMYQVHSFGDRIEIFKGKKKDEKGVFDQEVSEDWDYEGDLPGELARFNDKDPILILNKNGSICIQSKEGINIESEGDINLQSSGNIDMFAEKDIRMKSEKDMEMDAKHSIEEIASEIEIGSKEETRSIHLEAGSIHKESDMNYKLSNALEVKREQCVESLAYVHSNTTIMHNIQAAVGTKAAALETMSIGVGNKNYIVDVPVKAADVKNKVVKESNRLLTSTIDAIQDKLCPIDDETLALALSEAAADLNL